MTSKLIKCLKKLTICLLIVGIVGAFLMTSIIWHHIDSNETTRIGVAAIILLLMYFLIITELVDRNLAALIGAVMSIAAHDCLIGYVTMEEILQWEDVETLSLLFGMMVLVNVLSETGLFDFIAVWCYQRSAGRFWSLVTLLCFACVILSALIDNVSTMLLMAPTLVRLSELERIDPRYLLMTMVIVSNIGGCATPVGDPPNLIIIGDPKVLSTGINFAQFVAICTPASLICTVILLVYLRLVYKSKDSFRKTEAVRQEQENVLEASSYDAPMDQLLEELRLIDMFRDHLNLMMSKMRNQNLLMLVQSLDNETDRLERAIRELTVIKESGSLEKLESRRSSRISQEEMSQLMQTCSITNKPLLIQSILILLITVLLFFIQAIPEYKLTLGWISIFAALTLLVASSLLSEDGSQTTTQAHPSRFEAVISKIEWSTLIFFFALFIVMDVMVKLGLVGFLSSQIIKTIDLLPSGGVRLFGSMTIMLWTSAIASASIDNVPFTSMMVKVIGLMIEQDRVAGKESSTFVPLIYALAFGACLGGNGTLIGASANLVTAGISGKLGFPISFNMFFKFAAPITILTLLLVNAYLVVVFFVMQLW